MLEESEDWDVLIAWKIDRIHRNAVNFSKMLSGLQNVGKGFVAVYEDLDSTTVYGAFAMDIIARLAQLESEQLGERVLEGMAQKVRSGEFIGKTPFGYVNKSGKLEIAPEAASVYQAYVLKANGWDHREISRWLCTMHHGIKWDQDKVRRMISNPVYVGFVRWNGIIAKGNHRPIVPMEIWENINGKIQPSSRTYVCR